MTAEVTLDSIARKGRSSRIFIVLLTVMACVGIGGYFYVDSRAKEAAAKQQALELGGKTWSVLVCNTLAEEEYRAYEVSFYHATPTLVGDGPAWKADVSFCETSWTSASSRWASVINEILISGVSWKEDRQNKFRPGQRLSVLESRRALPAAGRWLRVETKFTEVASDNDPDVLKYLEAHIVQNK